MTIKELKQHLNTYEDDDVIAVMIWCRADVHQQAGQRGLELTDEEADEVIEFVDHHKDCEQGISWMTIDCALDEKGFSHTARIQVQ